MVVETRKFSIPTIYNRTRFRGKLEANWAEFFHRHKIVYAYEPEGFDLDGLWYLPDFFLPELRTIVEVKGIMDGLDRKKITALYRHCNDGYTLDDLPQLMMCGVPSGVNYAVIVEDMAYTYPRIGWETHMALCDQCHHWYFYNTIALWRCRFCGAHDGHHHIAQIHDSDCVICESQHV